MLTPTDFQLQGKLTSWSVYLVIILIIIATLVLIAWAFGIMLLKRTIFHPIAMNPTTAVTFIFSGTAFLLYSSKQVSSLKQNFGSILSILVLLIGLLKFAGVIFGFDTHIDAMLFSQKLPMDMPGNISNRMATTG